MRKTTQDDAPTNGGRRGYTWEPPSAQEMDEEAARAAPTSPSPRTGPSSGRFSGTRVGMLAALAFAIILVGAGAGFVGALGWPKTYAARAEVLFPLTQDQPTGTLREDRNMTTQLVLITGRPVLNPVATQLGRSVEDLQQHVTASVMQTSEIIEIQATDAAQQRAVQTAQAVVNSYLTVNQTNEPLLRQRLDTELSAATVAVTDAQNRLTTAQNAVTAGTATPQSVAPLKTAMQSAQTRQQQLQSQLDSLNQTDANPIAQLITPPYQAGVVSPNVGFAAMAGALVGLLLAIGVVAVVARNWMRG